MVVRARAERDAAGVARLDAVPRCEPFDERPRDRVGQRRGDRVRALRPGAVPSLPHREEEHHPLDVREGERRAHPVQRVRERVHEAPFAQEIDQLVDRRAVGLKIAVVLLGQVPDENVERDVVLGKPSRDLDREERVRPVRDAQRALDRVVVGDRDEGHAAANAGVVEHVRLRVRLAQAGPAKRVVAAVGRPGGMDVQIALAVRRELHLNSSYNKPAGTPSLVCHPDTTLQPATYRLWWRHARGAGDPRSGGGDTEAARGSRAPCRRSRFWPRSGSAPSLSSASGARPRAASRTRTWSTSRWPSPRSRPTTCLHPGLDPHPRRLGHQDRLPRRAAGRDGLDAREVRPGRRLDTGRADGGAAAHGRGDRDGDACSRRSCSRRCCRRSRA